MTVLGYKHGQVWANIGKDLIWESNDVKLLGITVDRDLKLGKPAVKICSKSNQLRPLSFNEKKTLFKAFVESQFKYCSIT